MRKVFVVWVTCEICMTRVGKPFVKNTRTWLKSSVAFWFEANGLAWLGSAWFWWWKADFSGNQSKMGIVFENEHGNENATAHLIRWQADFITSFRETKGAKANTMSRVCAQYTITEQHRHWNRAHTNTDLFPSRFSTLSCGGCFCCCCSL